MTFEVETPGKTIDIVEIQCPDRGGHFIQTINRDKKIGHLLWQQTKLVWYEKYDVCGFDFLLDEFVRLEILEAKYALVGKGLG